MMKKLILLFILMSELYYPQTRPLPGRDYFPHIGFFDFVVNALHHPEDGERSDALINAYSNQNINWYYNELQELGLTNLVTDANFTLQTNPNNNFYLNDMGFGWKHKEWGANQQVFLPSKYMNALGHSADYFPLEFGGDTIPTIQPDLNFGFTTAGGDKTCYWGMKANYLPNGTSVSGANKTDDTDNPISSVRYASTLEQHPAGVLLWGTIPWTHLANPGLNYRMRIRLRIVDHNPGVRKNVFQIAVNRSQVLIEDDPKIEAKRYFFKEPVPPPIESVGLSQVVTTDDLDEFTQYGWFETRGFNVTQDMNVSFSIYWYGDVDVYIDKVIFYSNEYRDIYVTEDIEMVRDIINGTTGLTANGNYPNDVGPTIAEKFQSFYVDEPFQLSASYRKELQYHIFQKGEFDENSTLEINGATGGVPAYFLQFDQKWAKPDNYRLKNYLLYNIYPFDKNTTYHQSIVQQRFDVMIGYRNYTDGTEADFVLVQRKTE